jgi:hypothetical protein
MTSNDTPSLQHMSEEERKVREAALDQTIESSFPASDPPSTNPNLYDHDTFPETATPPGERHDQLTGLGRARRARSGAASRGPS